MSIEPTAAARNAALTDKPALLIINRKSRSGDSDLSAAIEQLKAQGLELIEHYPENPEDNGRLVREYRDRVDRVIIGGGDGTVSCLAPSIVETGLPLGILPIGTANDLARTLQIPFDLPGACDVITGGRQHKIDLGRVNDRYFFNVANIGLGVQVTHNLTPEIKKRWGVFSYLHSVIRAIRDHRPFRAKVICDGHRFRVRTIQIAIGNGRHYGGGMTVAENAAIDDHLLVMHSIKPIRFWEWFTLAPALRTGRLKEHKGVRLIHGQRIEITTRKPKDITTDGELITRTPARFEVLPEAVAVYVPQYYVSPAAMENPDVTG